MRATFLLTLPVAATMAVGVSAQHHPMGFIEGWNNGTNGGVTMFHNPQSSFFPEGDFLSRIDSDDYRSWGRDPVVDSTYGTFCMIGVQFLVADGDLATPEFPVYVQGWTEDPVTPNFPDVGGFDPMTGGSNFLFAGPIPVNPFVVTEWALTFTGTVCVETEGDIFVGLSIGPDGSGEGMFMAAVGDSAAPIAPLTVFDDPGPAAAGIAEGSYTCILPTQTLLNQPPLPTGAPAVYTFYRSQNYFEVFLENASGGVCTAVTNQVSYDASHSANGDGTASFLSGLHPDAGNIPVNPGRADQIGFVYSDHRLNPGDPVFVVIALAENQPAFALTDILGGGAHTGRVLVDVINHFPVGSGLATPISVPELGLDYSRFGMFIDLIPTVRAFLTINQRTLLWQGLGLDSSFNIHATGLARQHF